MLNFTKIFNRSVIKPKIDFSKYKNKSILVTGSSGSIGKNIVKKLEKFTNNITAVDIDFDISKNSNINKLKKKNLIMLFTLLLTREQIMQNLIHLGFLN